MSKHLWGVVVACLLASCGGFKNGPDVDGGGDDAAAPGDGGATGDGATHGDDTGSGGDDSGNPGKDSGTTADSGGTEGGPGTEQGAGPWGDLPSGYCCTTDSDCRFRHCVDQGGGNLTCADECDGDPACSGQLAGFACVFDDAGNGLCQSTTPGQACVPAGQYTHGTKGLGACCTATHDARSGQECEGGHCAGFGSLSNPYICDNVCNGPVDCPGNFMCSNVGAYSICVPLADPYTCP
ncbi:MAG TPA: hypothetical protein VIF15_13275 [Polyangiaceae bacterium]